MTIQCCKCRRIREKGEWNRPPARLAGDISHTYCPACYDECLAEIDAYLIRRRSLSLASRLAADAPAAV